MPSSGLKIERLWTPEQKDDEIRGAYKYIQKQAEHAIKLGMFPEWLESFVGAWNETHDAVKAANAGIIEWDM